MEVLFNYKRTVEDFKQCGGKAGNPYNFPFVSECVGPSDAANGPCKESSAPVPCGDGTCRSDYVACLRALSDSERRGGLRSSVLWAFREYAQARAEQGLPELPADEAVLGGGGRGNEQKVGSASETAVDTGTTDAAATAAAADDRYMNTLFGASTAGDRSRGTARAPLANGEAQAAGKPAGKRSRPGGAKLGTSSDVSQWGGTLSYTDNGADAVFIDETL